jgi:hypothetical protein
MWHVAAVLLLKLSRRAAVTVTVTGRALQERSWRLGAYRGSQRSLGSKSCAGFSPDLAQNSLSAGILYHTLSSAYSPHVARCVPCALHVLSLHKVL